MIEVAKRQTERRILAERVLEAARQVRAREEAARTALVKSTAARQLALAAGLKMPGLVPPSAPEPPRPTGRGGKGGRRGGGRGE